MSRFNVQFDGGDAFCAIVFGALNLIPRFQASWDTATPQPICFLYTLRALSESGKS